MNYLFVLWGVWGLGKVCHRIGSRTSNGFEIYNDNLDSTSILKILLEFGQNGPKLKFLHLWFIPAIFSSTFIKVVIMVMFIVYRLTDIACRNLLYSKIRCHLSMSFFGVKTWYSQRRSLQGHPDEYMKWPKSPGSAERFFFSFIKGLRTAHRTMPCRKTVIYFEDHRTSTLRLLQEKSFWGPFSIAKQTWFPLLHIS
jgi:hypothetical protein